MRESGEHLLGYAKRLSRHFSAAAIAWLPLAGLLYVTRSVIGGDATLNVLLGSFALLSARAAWRARRPVLVAAPDGRLVVTNPWRRFRLSPVEVAGYTWTAPSWTGRDNAPIIAIVRTAASPGPRLVRITAMSGDEARELVRRFGLKEVAVAPDGALLQVEDGDAA